MRKGVEMRPHVRAKEVTRSEERVLRIGVLWFRPWRWRPVRWEG
jgi:hypothetical protein